MKPTTDEVLAWAREAGGWQQWEARVMTPQVLERFAALAYAAGAAAMKERAAKVCENKEQQILSKQSGKDFDVVDTNLRMIACVLPDVAAAIRALGDDDE